ncbi:hypothetical protein ACUY2K_11430, partial [Corynebacterium macginleyi]
FIEGHGIAFELFGVPGHGGRLPFFPARLGWISGVHRMGVRSRAKQGKRASATASRLVEGARVSGWKQAINKMAVAFPNRFDKYL